MKKVLAISSVLLGVAFLAGCGQQPVSQTQPTTSAPVAQQPVTNQPVAMQPPTNQDQQIIQPTTGQVTQPDTTNLNNETASMNQKISAWCEKNNMSGCLPITSSVLIESNDKYSVVKINDDTNFLLSKKDNEWNVSIVSQENNICDTGSNSPDLVEYCGGIVSPFITKKDDEEIVQKISAYCEKYNIPECLPVTPTADSRKIIDFDGKYAVIKVGSFNYLLTKKDNEWNVSIASQENNICETGSGNTDLVEYCKQ